jgi:rod shape-determining protein MreC
VTKHPSFHKKKSYTLPAFIIVLALIASFVIPARLALLRSAAVSAVYPFQFAAAVLWRGTASLPANLLALRDLAKNNAELKARLAALEPKLALLAELKSENDRLREALGFQNKSRFGAALLPAMVIGRSASNWNSIIEINRGSGSRVRVNLPVIVKAGLVGKVIEVSRFSAKVLLLTDPLFSAAAADQRSRDYGVAEGYAPFKLRLKYVRAGGDVVPGDPIVTSAISSLFPPGIPVGTVSRAAKKETDLFYEIEITPAADLSKLEEVFVVL